MRNKLFRLFSKLFSLEKQAKRAGVIMGSNNFLSSVFWSSEPYLIKIGSNCQITSGVKFFTHGGAGAVRDKYPKFDCFGKIEIGDFVYIGCNSLIMPGVIIGDNVLIAAGSVITKSVPSNFVVGGNPARIICSTEEYINSNLAYNLDTKNLDSMTKKNIIMNISESRFISKGFLSYK